LNSFLPNFGKFMIIWIKGWGKMALDGARLREPLAGLVQRILNLIGKVSKHLFKYYRVCHQFRLMMPVAYFWVDFVTKWSVWLRISVLSIFITVKGIIIYTWPNNRNDYIISKQDWLVATTTKKNCCCCDKQQEELTTRC